jgi:hypothetical protein
MYSIATRDHFEAMLMRNKSWGDFVDKKKRESIRQLKILSRLLERNGMKVERFLEESVDTDGDPYIFCFNPTRNGSFDGLRIYKIGNDIAFRIQKENKTHPYGSAYPIPVEDMFKDFMSDDDIDERNAGMKVIESVGKEVKKFFERAIDAEKEERHAGIDKDSEGTALVRTSGTDYSALVYNKA